MQISLLMFVSLHPILTLNPLFLSRCLHLSRRLSPASGHGRTSSFPLLGWTSYQSHFWHHPHRPKGKSSLVEYGMCHFSFFNPSLWKQTSLNGFIHVTVRLVYYLTQAQRHCAYPCKSWHLAHIKLTAVVGVTQCLAVHWLDYLATNVVLLFYRK